MRLLTINIQHGGGARVDRVAAFLGALAPDVAVLTEYREGERGKVLRAKLAAEGYLWQAASSLEPKQNGVCVVAKQPFTVATPDYREDPDLHRLLAVRFATFNVVGVYFPQGKAKRPVFDRLTRTYLPWLGSVGVVVGDFNTGLPFEDEAENTFACSDCFASLLSAGLVDSWRKRHPKVREFSWYSQARNGFRVDHALSTVQFDGRISSVDYLHSAETIARPTTPPWLFKLTNAGRHPLEVGGLFFVLLERHT